MDQFENLINSFYGFDFIPSELMVDQVRAKRNKKKRIDKKWLKRYGYISKPKKEVYIINRKIYGHPEMIKLIKEAIKKENGNERI